MQLLGAREQIAFGFEVVRIRDAAVHRADGGAGFLVVEADALGAELRVDDEDVLALADGLVGTLRLTSPAVDAFFGDDGCHSLTALPLLDFVRSGAFGASTRGELA